MNADRIVEYLEIAGLVVALASAVAAATPTESDNRVIAAVIRVLDAFALNWGRRNPRKPQEDPARNRTDPPRGMFALFLLPLAGLFMSCSQADERSAGGATVGAAELSRAAAATVQAWNAAGVDPLRADEATLARIVAVCTSAGILTTLDGLDKLHGLDGLDLPTAVGEFCVAALAAARPARAPEEPAP